MHIIVKVNGKTALMVAASKGHLTIMVMLLEAGARRDLYDKVCACGTLL
jgi:ankyrin repeat protein